MEDDFIEIYDDLNIENFSLNSDKKIITIIQKNKIKFFSTNNFKEFSDNLGDKFNNIKICLPIYSSEYVLIVGNLLILKLLHSNCFLVQLIHKNFQLETLL